MEVDEFVPLPPSWFEFLLDRTLLERHLRQEVAGNKIVINCTIEFVTIYLYL